MKNKRTKQSSKQRSKQEVKKKRYRSDFEKTVAKQFKNRRIKFEYEPVRLRYRDAYDRQRITVPDFLVKPRNADLWQGIFVEAKGYLSPQGVLKYEAFAATRADVDLRFVFWDAGMMLFSELIDSENNSGCSVATYERLPNLNYGEWAEKLGFPWCHQTLPEDWIDEMKDKTKR